MGFAGYVVVTGIAVVTGLVCSNGLLAVVSNKSLSNQYFIDCLFHGHYSIMNRLRPFPTFLPLPQQVKHALVVISAMVENELA